MKFSALPALAVVATLASGIQAVDYASQLTSTMSQATADVLAALEAEEAALSKRGVKASCTVRNIVFRQEL
jgi:hypothetical protein